MWRRNISVIAPVKYPSVRFILKCGGGKMQVRMHAAWELETAKSQCKFTLQCGGSKISVAGNIEPHKH